MQAPYKPVPDDYPAPDDYTFYYPPQELLEGEHGKVIWSRPLEGEAAAALKDARSNTLVLYCSRGAPYKEPPDVPNTDKPIAVSGIIALPPEDAPKPKDGYPIVSWAHGTVGSADVCAPSRDDESLAAHPFNKYPHVLLNAFLNKGWAVLMTDYEGLGTGPEGFGPDGLDGLDPENFLNDEGRGPEGLHPFLLGASQARGILDIVLAARQLYPDQLSNRLAIVGHSQGGQAALFGAHHAPTWTPDLDLRGVAALAPVSDIYTLFTTGCILPTKDKGFAFTALFLSGAIAGDPNIKPKELLGAEAYKRWPHIYTRARIELSQDDSWGGLLGIQQLSPPPLPPKKNPSRTAFFDQLKLMHPDLDIPAPVRISQANEDERVRAGFTNTLVEQLKARNGPDNVEYKPYPEVSSTDNPELGYHFGLMETDLPFLTEWLEKRFADTD
jgi:hypothetical protein